MRTLNFGLRVTDPERSLAFYKAVGYEVLGVVPETSLGRLTILKLPDDEFATVELVHDPDQTDLGGNAHLSHFAIAVESMAVIVSKLAALGISTEPPVSPDGSDDFLTTWIVDPDGRRIELVQWPAGHADGITAADFAERAP